MKKKRILQTVLIAMLTLIVGFFAGIFLVGFPPDAYVLPGSISRLNSYRNVKITENDIALRNELLDNSELQIQYRDYLNYYYISASQATTNLSKLIDVSSRIDDFQVVYADYAEQLTSYRKFLDSGRVDILDALTTVVSLSKDQKLPVVESLNQAGIAISRLHHLDGVLAEFLMAISDFLHNRPDTDYPALADIHDLLAINIFESAYMTQNKPLLKYLDKTSTFNDAEGIKELVDGSNMATSLNNFLTLDLKQLQNVQSNADLLGSSILGMVDQLGGFFPCTICYNSFGDGGQLLLNVEHFGSAIQNNAVFENVMSSVNQLGVVFDSAELLGVF